MSCETEKDPEFDALQTVLDAVRPLNPDAAARVLLYVAKRLGVSLLPFTPSSSTWGGGMAGIPQNVEHHHHYPHAPLRVGPDHAGTPLPNRTEIIG